jgi:hypothetical protein
MFHLKNVMKERTDIGEIEVYILMEILKHLYQRTFSTYKEKLFSKNVERIKSRKGEKKRTVVDVKIWP